MTKLLHFQSTLHRDLEEQPLQEILLYLAVAALLIGGSGD